MNGLTWSEREWEPPHGSSASRWCWLTLSRPKHNRRTIKKVERIRNIDFDTRFLRCSCSCRDNDRHKNENFYLVDHLYDGLVTRAGSWLSDVATWDRFPWNRFKMNGVADTHGFLNVWRYVADSHCLNLRAVKLTRRRCRRCHVGQHFFSSLAQQNLPNFNSDLNSILRSIFFRHN